MAERYKRGKSRWSRRYRKTREHTEGSSPEVREDSPMERRRPAGDSGKHHGGHQQDWCF